MDIEEAALLSDRVVVIGGTPCRIIDDVAIDLGAERDADLLRFESGFRSIDRCLQLSLSRARGDGARGEQA